MSSNLTPASQTETPSPCKPCGHHRHVGWCSTCQRIQLARWSAQLAQVRPARRDAQH